MQVLETMQDGIQNENTEINNAQLDESNKSDAEKNAIINSVLSAIAEDDMGEYSTSSNDAVESNAENTAPLSSVGEADVKRHIEESSAASSASKTNGDRFDLVTGSSEKRKTVLVTQEEKDKFLSCVVTGERYTGSASVFGGKVLLTFRSRSAIESEAIDAFLRYRGTHGIIKNGVAYSDAMRFCMLAAGVESINGEKFPTITEAAEGREGLFYTESKDGVVPPKWVWLYDKWRDRTEAFVASILNEYFAFEAKYWLMIEKAQDENFWKPDGSTGE